MAGAGTESAADCSVRDRGSFRVRVRTGAGLAPLFEILLSRRIFTNMSEVW